MANVIIQTDQSGANDPISTSNNRIYNFQAGSGTVVDQGKFEIKRGSASTDGITATLYNAFDGGGTALTSVFVSVSSITQTYSTITFIFNYVIPTSGNYSLKLSSTTADSGSSQYFIKSGNFQIVDSTTLQVINTFDASGNVISPTPTPTLTLTSTPTPTPTLTLTSTPTLTASPTLTSTSTTTPTSTPTLTLTNSPTLTSSLALTSTTTPTLTPTNSPTLTETPTLTPTLTQTLTLTPTSTSTSTPTPTPTINKSKQKWFGNNNGHWSLTNGLKKRLWPNFSVHTKHRSYDTPN